MKSKQTSHSPKEMMCFCVRNHEQRASIMRKWALIIVVLMMLQNFYAQAATTEFSINTTHKASTSLLNFAKEGKISNKSNINVKERHSISTDTMKKNQISNIKIYPVYISIRNKIVLNVSWDRPSDWSNINSYHVKISANTTKNICRHTNPVYENIVNNLTAPTLYFPPETHWFDVKPGCTYLITIIKGQTNNSTVYTLPQCVGKLCSCEHLTPRIQNLTVTEVYPKHLNISWDLHYNKNNKSVLDIRKVLFEYRVSSEGIFSKLYSSVNHTYNKNYFIWTETNQTFSPNKTYQLQVVFTNVYNCKARNSTNFTVHEVKTPNNTTNIYITTRTPNSINALEITLLVAVISFFLIAILYLFRRNRLIIKELVQNPFVLRFSRDGSRRQELYVLSQTNGKRREEANLLYVDKEIVDGNVDRYEFPRAKIQIIEEIGKGAFGEVFKAKAYDIKNQPGYTFVAVKRLRERAPPEEMDDFLSEIDILKKVGEHPNIVTIYGCCILQEPYLMIMEYVPCGDLKRYLLNLREKWILKKRTRNDSSAVFTDTSDGTYITPDSPRSRLTSGERPSVTETEYTSLGSEGFQTPTELQNNRVECILDHTELQNFALQIAKGMEHLEKIPIAHRDLAARNILINEFRTLKISDFGLSRIGPYVNTKKKKLPLRWMSIEAIEDNFYDSKSDVWSFAVVLWEIGTLGAFPYENVIDVMVPYHLARGERLPRPEICTDDLYSLMLKCWSQSPKDRPSFQELVDSLDVKRKRIYVDFNQLNPLYVFPPSEIQEQEKKSNLPLA